MCDVNLAASYQKGKLMKKTFLTIVIIIALFAVIGLASGFRIPPSVMQGVQSALPADQATPLNSPGSRCLPTAQSRGFRCIPRDRAGNVGQLGGSEIPAENEGLPAGYYGGGR